MREVLVAALAVGLVLLLPLRLAIDWLGLDTTGFAAREAQGSGAWPPAPEQTPPRA